MIQPRFGFNYNPFPGTVVRGGYGFFYGQISNSAYFTERRENGVYQKQYGPISALTAHTPYTACTATTGACTVSYQNNGAYLSYSPAGGVPIFTPPDPAGQRPHRGAPITSTGLAAVPTGTITIRGLDPSFTNPLSQSYDLTVEQELPLHSSFTIGYVGNRATHLPVYIDTNVDPNSVTTATPTSTPTPPPARQGRTHRLSTPTGSTPTPAQSRPASPSSIPGTTPSSSPCTSP